MELQDHKVVIMVEFKLLFQLQLSHTPFLFFVCV